MISALDVVARAYSMLGQGTIYAMGKGGYRPQAALASDEQKRLDCSGFVAWCLGSPRKVSLPAYLEFLGQWVETTAIVRDAKAPAGMFVEVQVPEPGDVIVYGDNEHGSGHCGIVTVTSGIVAHPTLDQVLKVVHCSAGNYRHLKDAVQETDARIFAVQAKTLVARCYGVDYTQQLAA